MTIQNKMLNLQKIRFCPQTICLQLFLWNAVLSFHIFCLSDIPWLLSRTFSQRRAQYLCPQSSLTKRSCHHQQAEIFLYYIVPRVRHYFKSNHFTLYVSLCKTMKLWITGELVKKQVNTPAKVKELCLHLL